MTSFNAFSEFYDFAYPLADEAEVGIAEYALKGATPLLVMDAASNAFMSYETGAGSISKNLYELFDSGRTDAATCIDADGSLKWGLHNLVDTRLNDSGQWAPTGVTADTTDPADELMPDPSFDDPDAANDELVSGWEVTGGELVVTNSAAYNSSVSQVLSTPLAVGETYRITYEITAFTSGAVRAQLSGGGATVSLAARTSMGVYTETFTAEYAHTTCGFQATVAGTTLSIDNVSVLPVISSGTDSAGEKRYLLTEDTANSTHEVGRVLVGTAGKTYTTDVRVKAHSGTRTFSIKLPSGVFGANVTYSYDLDAETATQSTAGTNDSGSIENLGNGEYLCRLTADAATTGQGQFKLYLENAALTYTGDGTSGMYVSQATVYQSSVGPRVERVVNGTFDSDISGWSDTSGAGGTASWNAAGYLDVTNTSGTARASQTITLEAGKTYSVSINVISPAAGGGAVQIALSGDPATTLFDLDDLGVGEHVVEYTATADDGHYLTVKQFSVGTSTVDNLSILPVTPQMQKSTKDNSLFMENETGAPKFAVRVDHSNGVPEVLAEPAGTNELRNSTMQGAAVGVVGSGGALPTNWQHFNTAIEIVAIGEEGGFSYIDLRFTGTPTGNPTVRFEPNTSIAASDGETWTGSVYYKQIAGTTTNLSGTVSSTVRNFTSVPAFHSLNSVDTPISASITRVSSTDTLDDSNGTGTISNTTTDISLNWTSGAIDITIRMYAPQIEQSHKATSFIPTTTAATTRVKDEPTRAIPEGFIHGEGSIYFEGSIDYETGGSNFPRAITISDGTEDNRVVISTSEPGGNYLTNVRTAGVSVANDNHSKTSGTVAKVAFRYADNDFASSFDGASVHTDTSLTVPTNLSTIKIGDIGGVIRTVRIRDFRLSQFDWTDAELVDLST